MHFSNMQAVKLAREAAERALKVAGAWAETKPWINATDAEEIVEKVRAFVFASKGQSVCVCVGGCPPPWP